MHICIVCRMWLKLMDSAVQLVNFCQLLPLFFFFYSDNVTAIGLFSAKATQLQVQKEKLLSILHHFHQILQFRPRCLQIYPRCLPFHPRLLNFHPRCLPLKLFQSRERKGRNSRLLITSSKSKRSSSPKKQRRHEADIVQ